MRELYNSTHKQGKGFTSEEWWSTVSRLSGGKSFTDFNAKYIDGREPYPWNEVLPLAGLMLAADSLREPKMGISTSADSTGVRVEEIEPGSAAATAGVKVGDYLVAIGEIMLADPAFLEKFKVKYATGNDAQIPIRVQRAGQPMTLLARVQLELRVQHVLRPMPNASDKAARIRSGLFRGAGD
jgi:predicted metalloprotease with PDZ domain